MLQAEDFISTSCPIFVFLNCDVGDSNGCEPSTQAFCRISHTFQVKVDSDPEVDSRAALQSRQNFPAVVVLSTGDDD